MAELMIPKRLAISSRYGSRRVGRLRPVDYIRLIVMPGDPNPVPPGSTGTVMFVKEHGSGGTAWLQIGVDWDNGRSLMLVVPPDEFDIK